MSFTDEKSNGFYMPVAPASGNGYGNGGFFGGDWAWILLLLLIGGNGWGFGGGFGMGGMMPWLMGGMGGGFGLDYLYPWLNNSQHISDGFRDQYLNTQIGDLRTDVNRGFGDVQLGLAGVNQNICQTGNGITQAINSGFSGAEIAANSRQMANMQQLFGVQSALQNCCCENRAGLADLKYTVATENCADRQALNDVGRDLAAQSTANTNALLNTINGGIQSIKDQLCNERIERKDDTINQLRSEVMFYREQTARDAQVDQIYNRFASCPVDTTPVYGHQPIHTCPQNQNNCGFGSCGNLR